MHSFGMTSKYIVMLEQPLFVNKTATNGVNLHHHLKWKPHFPVSKIFERFLFLSNKNVRLQNISLFLGIL